MVVLRATVALYRKSECDKFLSRKKGAVHPNDRVVGDDVEGSTVAYPQYFTHTDWFLLLRVCK